MKHTEEETSGFGIVGGLLLAIILAAAALSSLAHGAASGLESATPPKGEGGPAVPGGQLFMQMFVVALTIAAGLLVGNTNHVGYGSDYIPDMNKTMKLVMSKANAYPDMGMKPGTTKKGIEMYGPTANPARILPALVDQMLDHGYKEKDIHKILGGNIMRVFDECWSGSDTKIVDPPAFHKDWR